LSQTAGPSITYVTPSVKTISVTEVTSVTTTIGGQLRWAPGAQFSVTVSVTTTTSMPVYARVWAKAYSGNSWASTTGWTLSGNPTYVRFYAFIYESSAALTCYLIGGSAYLEPSPQYNYPP
jgi:hypothetical protein